MTDTKKKNVGERGTDEIAGRQQETVCATILLRAVEDSVSFCGREQGSKHSFTTPSNQLGGIENFRTSASQILITWARNEKVYSTEEPRRGVLFYVTAAPEFGQKLLF